MRKDCKILFFDIDGTLAIGHDIPSSTQQALKKLQAEGQVALMNMLINISMMLLMDL